MKNNSVASSTPPMDKPPVFLREYSITGTTKKRVWMRFVNFGKPEITGARYLLRELDEEGNLLDERIMGLNGISVKHLAEFEASSEVHPDCVGIEVRVESVSVRVRYDTQRRPSSPAEQKNKPAPTYSVSSKRKRYILLVVLAILVFFLIAGLLAWRAGFFTELREGATDVDLNYIQNDTGLTHYAET